MENPDNYYFPNNRENARATAIADEMQFAQLMAVYERHDFACRCLDCQQFLEMLAEKEGEAA